jgi:DNA-binding transcriptional ArsR family regulator
MENFYKTSKSDITNMNAEKDLYGQQSNNDFFRFLEVKTEKLVTALYMITNFLSDKEPIKWRLRDVSLSMLSQASVLKEKNSAEQANILSSMLVATSETLSLLEIAHLSGYISEMNYAVLRREYDGLVDQIQGRAEIQKSVHRVSLPETFFSDDTHGATPSLPSSSQATRGNVSRFDNSHTSTSRVAVGGSSAQTSEYERDYFSEKDKTNSVPHIQNVSYGSHDQKDKTDVRTGTSASAETFGKIDKVKNKRREIILQMLRDKSDLTIKDIASEITDCSEKTIQRELVALLESGSIKRTGERRWSRYSLNS